MNEYPIDVEQATLWFRSKASLLKNTGVSMAEVQASTTNVPSARADFDSERGSDALVFGQVEKLILKYSGDLMANLLSSIMNP